MQKKAGLWKKILVATTFAMFAVMFIQAILQEKYGAYFDLWPIWTILSLVFAGSMIMALIKGGQAKMKESQFEDSRHHAFDQLVGKFMVFVGIMVIGMMLLGVCAYFAS